MAITNLDDLFKNTPTYKEEQRIKNLKEDKELLEMCLEYKDIELEGPSNLFVSLKYKIYDVRKMKMETNVTITIPRLSGRLSKSGEDKRKLLAEGVDKEIIRQAIQSYGNLVTHVKIQSKVRIDKKTKKDIQNPVIIVYLQFNSKVLLKDVSKYYKVFRDKVKALKP